ncbi:hypothetical protein ATN79_47150 [Paraburkholderia caribensis]|nr:hypothetical protein ATN79_47150 [Paraburkholderia caribensis]
MLATGSPGEANFCEADYIYEPKEYPATEVNATRFGTCENLADVEIDGIMNTIDEVMNSFDKANAHPISHESKFSWHHFQP